MRLSDGEKLILMMLSELYKHLEVKGGIDPHFVQETIRGDHLWGFKWKYHGIPFESQEMPPNVSETLDFLEMWAVIESSYRALSPKDKTRIKQEAAPFGSHVRFEGFDGNHEPHMHIAKYLVDQLDRFSEFKGRNLNSRTRSIEGYQRMWHLFEPMHKSMDFNRTLLSAEQIIQLLLARNIEGTSETIAVD